MGIHNAIHALRKTAPRHIARAVIKSRERDPKLPKSPHGFLKPRLVRLYQM